MEDREINTELREYLLKRDIIEPIVGKPEFMAFTTSYEWLNGDIGLANFYLSLSMRGKPSFKIPIRTIGQFEFYERLFANVGI